MWVSQGYQEYQEGRKLPKLVFMSPHGLLSFHAGGGRGEKHASGIQSLCLEELWVIYAYPEQAGYWVP